MNLLNRLATSTVIALGIGSLSCGVFSQPTQRGALAAVDVAAPPPVEASTAPHVVAPHDATVELATSHSGETIALANDAELEATILSELFDRHTGLSDTEVAHLARTIMVEAKRNELDPELVLAVIQVESGGYHLAVSSVGALGLMQLLPSTAEELARKHGHDWRGPNSLFDPILNVRLGTAYLRQLSLKYGSVSTALAAYNWGPGRIDRRLRRGASVPSRYIEQVMKFYGDGDAAKGAATASRS